MMAWQPAATGYATVMPRVAKRLVLVLLPLVLVGCGAGAAGPQSSSGAQDTAQPVVLATTTSTQDSGLLDLLVPLFEKQHGWQVKTVSVGTGAALELGAKGEADVVLVHAPDAEKQWMAQGYGAARL